MHLCRNSHWGHSEKRGGLKRNSLAKFPFTACDATTWRYGERNKNFFYSCYPIIHFRSLSVSLAETREEKKAEHLMWHNKFTTPATHYRPPSHLFLLHILIICHINALMHQTRRSYQKSHEISLRVCVGVSCSVRDKKCFQTLLSVAFSLSPLTYGGFCFPLNFSLTTPRVSLQGKLSHFTWRTWWIVNKCSYAVVSCSLNWKNAVSLWVKIKFILHVKQKCCFDGMMLAEELFAR